MILAIVCAGLLAIIALYAAELLQLMRFKREIKGDLEAVRDLLNAALCDEERPKPAGWPGLAQSIPFAPSVPFSAILVPDEEMPDESA